MATVIGYATFVDPSIVAQHVGEFPYDLVWVQGQRFFGAADPNTVGKTLEEVIGVAGRLTVADIGVLTVDTDSRHEYNAAAYTGLNEEQIAALDKSETATHFERVRIDALKIVTYPERSEWSDRGEPVYVYVAKRIVQVSGLGQVSLVRRDVRPNAGYLGRCLRAAGRHGIEFALHYAATTFLADRTTPIKYFG